MITPLAPLTPYTALAAASLRTEKDSISAADKSSSVRSIPSTSTNGSRPAPWKEDIPRIQKLEPSAPGSPERCTAMTPANCPAKLLDTARVVPCCKASGRTDVIEPTTDTFFWLP